MTLPQMISRLEEIFSLGGNFNISMDKNLWSVTISPKGLPTVVGTGPSLVMALRQAFLLLGE